MTEADAFLGLDHVQVAAPPGCEEAGRRFYGSLLGLRELTKPAPLAARGGLWFACGAHQVHVGVDAEFVPAAKAHPALRVRDAQTYAALRERLLAAGQDVRDDFEIPELARCFLSDPWGNRVELVAPRS